MVNSSILLIVVCSFVFSILGSRSQYALAFLVQYTSSDGMYARTSVVLALAKSRNKQAELRQKMEEAIRQNQRSETPNLSEKSWSNLSDDKIKEQNDRLRFAELLKAGASSVLNDYSSDGYLNKNQEEEEINAALAGYDRIFEGDPAPTDCFEDLVSIKSSNAIGSTGKQRLVPWLHKNPTRHNDYLVIITEPRLKSPVLYETVKSFLKELPIDIRNHMIIVNADSPSENRRWLKKMNLGDESITIFSDEKREFMRHYTALGENRWSMTMFIISQGRVLKLARDIDQYGASRTVQNAVASLSEPRI